jgi:predicted acetyltransferase
LCSPILAPDHPTDEDLSLGTPVKREDGARKFCYRSTKELGTGSIYFHCGILDGNYLQESGPKFQADWRGGKMNKADGLRPKIALNRASLEQKQVLDNLLELYTHDFCEFIDREIGPDGRFGCWDLDLCWANPNWLPFLIYADDRLAGFVVINACDSALHAGVRDVAEFFILRGYRGHGIGTEAAHQIWRRFPGRWEVRVMASNEPAYRFWHRAIKRFAGDGFVVNRYDHAGSDWHRFSFESGP